CRSAQTEDGRSNHQYFPKLYKMIPHLEKTIGRKQCSVAWRVFLSFLVRVRTRVGSQTHLQELQLKKRSTPPRRPWFFQTPNHFDPDAGEHFVRLIMKFCTYSKGRMRSPSTAKVAHRHQQLARRFVPPKKTQCTIVPTVLMIRTRCVNMFGTECVNV